MKVFEDFISKLDSTEKNESNFGNLSMKKGGSFQKERFSFLINLQWGVDPRNPPPPRAYATGSAQHAEAHTFTEYSEPVVTE